MKRTAIIPAFLVTPFFDIKWELSKEKKKKPAYTFLDVPGLDYAVNYLKFRSSPKCLDLGCGDGRYALTYAQKTNARVLAIDISRKAIERTKERAVLMGLSHLIETKTADISKFEYSEKYDLISANNVLHYFTIPQIKKIIRQMKVRTKERGLNYIIFEAEIEMILSNGERVRFENQLYREVEYMKKIMKDIYSDWRIEKIIETKADVSSTMPKKFQSILKKYLPKSTGTISDKYNRKFKELTILAKKI